MSKALLARSIVAGVVVVLALVWLRSRPAPRGADASEVSLVEDLEVTLSDPVFTFGLDDGPEDDLHGVTGATLRGDTLVILNARSGELKLIDLRSGESSVAGRRGSGPGEFRWMQLGRDCASDSILVYDVRLRRVSLLSPDGEFGRLVNLARSDGTRGLTRPPVVLGRIASSEILVLETGPQRPSQEGVTRLDASLVAYSDDGRIGPGLHRLKGDEVRISAGPAGTIISALPFLQRTVTALGCSRVFYVEGPEPALHELDLALGPQPGTPVQTTRYELPIPPRRLARETYDSWVEWQLERAPEGARAATREFYASIFSEWPLPPVVSLFVDDMERVWVEAYSAEGQHNWLVLELPSAYGVLEVPNNLQILDVVQSKAITRMTTPDGEEFVEIRRIEVRAKRP